MSLRIFFILIATTVVGMLAFPQPQQPRRRSGESPVIHIDFNYEGSRAEKTYRSLDQVAYEDGSNRARTTYKDSYGNPVAYDTLDDVDARRPSKNNNKPLNYVIPGYASGILEEEAPTRSTNFDNQEARRINDDRIHFVDPQTSIFVQSANNPQLPTPSSLSAEKPINDPLNPENIHLPDDPKKSEGVAFVQNDRSRSTISQGILPPINDPLNPENIHLPDDPHRSEGVPANDNSRPTHGFLPPIDDPLNPGNIHLPVDPQKSEGVPATFFQSADKSSVSHGLLPPIDDPLNPGNINLPSDPQASEGVSATFFQNDKSRPSVSHGLLPPINDPLNPENIHLPSDPQKSEGLPSTLDDGNALPLGLEPPQLPNIDVPSYNSNPFLPPAVNTFNHPKTSTFNSEGPVIITDEQISFAPRPSNGLQPPKDPQQDINVNFQAPTASSAQIPTTPKKFTGSFTGSLSGVPTTQQTLQQIPVVVVQSPKEIVNKYKGTFGGPPGVLTSNEFGSVQPTQAAPQISPSTSTLTVNNRFQGGFGGAPGILGAGDSSQTYKRPSLTNVISSAVERTVNKYQGNFGGPSGVLQPFDNKA